MLPLNFDPFPVLETTRLVLDQLAEKDIPGLFSLRSDPAIMKYLDRDPMKSPDEARDLIHLLNQEISQNNNITWAIRLKDDQNLIGTISFWKIDKTHHRAEIGYILAQEYWGKGIMDEAIKSVIIFGFHQMKIHSIEANTNPLNKASQALLLKNNFRLEAHYSENYYYKGEYSDSEIFSLLEKWM